MARPEALIRMVGFEEAVRDHTGGQPKVHRRDYLPDGAIPVIDQGHSFVAGYTNDKRALFEGDLPVVLFGDHTLTFKYVDFPFALGADGVKALSIKDAFCPKYLFYYWQSHNIQSQGYSRHFKFLKEIELPLIPLSEQRRVVKLLDQAEALPKRHVEASAKAARILPALFYKIFGDPATNSKRWPTAALEELAEIGTELIDPNQSPYLDLVHIGAEQIEKETGRILAPTLVRNSHLRSGKFYFTAAHVLYSKIRPYLNKVAFPRCEGICSADIYPIRPRDSRLSNWYIVALLRSPAFLAYARVHSDRLRIPKLNREQLGAFVTPIPSTQPLGLFDTLAEQVEDLARDQFDQSNRIAMLFNTLLYRAFTGDLTAKWREAHMKQLLAEMQEQEKLLGIPRC